jgi:hypothetical protein
MQLVETVFPCPFYFSESGFISLNSTYACRTTAANCRSGLFSYLATLSVSKQYKFRNIWTWNNWSKVKLEQFSCCHTGTSYWFLSVLRTQSVHLILTNHTSDILLTRKLALLELEQDSLVFWCACWRDWISKSKLFLLAEKFITLVHRRDRIQFE